MQEQEKQKNPLGLTGFILSLVAIPLSCISDYCLALSVAALVFSIVGICKKNSSKGLSIAGLVISVVWLVIVVAVAAYIFAHPEALHQQ